MWTNRFHRDHIGSCRLPRRESCCGCTVVEHLHYPSRFGDAGCTSEHQPVQWRAGGPVAWRPPEHELALRPGQRHVQQSQFFACFFSLRNNLSGVVPRAFLPTDVEDAAPIRIVQQLRRRVEAAYALPTERDVDDREFEPFGGVHGCDLYSGSITVEATASVGGTPGRRILDPIGEPANQCAQPERFLGGDAAEKLCDVPQIGEISFAGRGREYTLLQIRFGGDPFEHGREPDACEQPGV